MITTALTSDIESSIATKAEESAFVLEGGAWWLWVAVAAAVAVDVDVELLPPPTTPPPPSTTRLPTGEPEGDDDPDEEASPVVNLRTAHRSDMRATEETSATTFSGTPTSASAPAVATPRPSAS